MFPIAWPVVVLFLVVGTLVATVLGALAGTLASLCLKLPKQGVLKRDGLLGLIGFALGMAIPILIRPLGLFFINRFVDPYLVAWTVAVLLPVASELFRLGRSRSRRQNYGD
jgi:uncharacterized membrane protein YeaQ/YmgE (transglycosylase-associated protein family)